MTTPRVSIITVTFNAERHIERTLRSIERQDYPNVECIVVDGKSTDSTMDIVRRFSSFVTKCVSEPDNGLYFAMNKGLAMAEGDYVLFINAGDELSTEHTLSDIFAVASDADVYYGDTLIVDEEGNAIGPRRLRPPKCLTWKSFRMGMLVCHQSFVARRSLCADYDTRYRLSADFDWCIRVMKRSTHLVDTGIVIAHFMQGGMTKQHQKQGLRERFQIMVHHYGLLRTLWSHLLITLRALIK